MHDKVYIIMIRFSDSQVPIDFNQKYIILLFINQIIYLPIILVSITYVHVQFPSTLYIINYYYYIYTGNRSILYSII